MKKTMIALLAALSLTALVAGGCSSKNVVKTEDSAAATVKTDPTRPTQQPASGTADSTPTQKQIAEASAKSAEADAARAAAAAISPFEAVFFDFDKSDLSQDARTVLAKNADLMQKSRKADKVRIEGHCDERGSAEYNLALGERRAKSAMQYLITLGVKADRLSVVSYGKEKPAVQGSTEEAWAKNRRAEFVVDK